MRAINFLDVISMKTNERKEIARKKPKKRKRKISGASFHPRDRLLSLHTLLDKSSPTAFPPDFLVNRNGSGLVVRQPIVDRPPPPPPFQTGDGTRSIFSFPLPQVARLPGERCHIRILCTHARTRYRIASDLA